MLARLAIYHLRVPHGRHSVGTTPKNKPWEWGASKTATVPIRT